MSTNKRYITTWKSEDLIDWQLSIIPSDAAYTSGFTDITLPAEFLLRDMKLDTDLGDIPSGLTSQVLNLTINLAALQGTTDLNNFRTALLRGTTTLKYPKTSAGVDVTEAGQFKAFNTFILQYNDGSGLKTAFIGCQKFSASNELEVTPLENVVKLSIEVHDITRCIGEQITEVSWCHFLQNTSDSTTLPEPENSNYTEIRVGYDYTPEFGTSGRYWALDKIQNGLLFRIQRIDKLFSKISEMYAAYLRALTQNNASTYSIDNMFLYSMSFYKLRTTYDAALTPLTFFPYLVTEIYDKDGKAIGGAFRDKAMFAQYKTFHDVLKALVEQSLQTYRLSYTQTGTNPQSYGVTYTADYVLPENFFSATAFAQANIYGNVKVKLLSETLNQVTVNVSTMKGAQDVEEYIAANQSASTDDSKDLNIMLHNYPLATDRRSWNDEEKSYYSRYEADEIYIRDVINGGMLVYIDDASGRVSKIDTKIGVNGFFTAYEEIDYYFVKVSGANFGGFNDQPLYRLYMYFEQTSRNDGAGGFIEPGAGLGNVIARYLVNVFGNEKQAVADFKTTYTLVKYNHVAMSCIMDFEDLNPLLSVIYGSDEANGLIMKTSHDVYSGMVDVTVRIHGLEVV
jgi:hypothetical protein